MRKIVFLTLVFCFSVGAAFAQSNPDFSGSWELDTSKSKLDERMRVESMTLTVTQTEKELTTVTTAKRVAQTDGGGGMNRVGGMSADGQVMKYSLEGKETQSQVGGGMMAGAATLKASLEADGKLKLSSVRNVRTQMGDFTITTKETWELADEGKTLKISRTMETPRGTNSSDLIFTRKTKTNDLVEGANTGDSTKLPASPKLISGGVLNGKATMLVKPRYPDEARSVRASGAVNVQITIDEQGQVILARAVSGHPLLRAASEEAARASTFAPTMLEGVPVKVNGVVVYNFVP